MERPHNMDDCLTTKDIAKVLGISRVRAWQLVSSGKIKGKKIGTMWFVVPMHFRNYLKEKGLVK